MTTPITKQAHKQVREPSRELTDDELALVSGRGLHLELENVTVSGYSLSTSGSGSSQSP